MFPHTPKWSKKAILVFLVIVIIIYWFLVKSSDYVLPMILNNEEGSGIKGELFKNSFDLKGLKFKLTLIQCKLISIVRTHCCTSIFYPPNSLKQLKT